MAFLCLLQELQEESDLIQTLVADLRCVGQSLSGHPSGEQELAARGKLQQLESELAAVLLELESVRDASRQPQENSAAHTPAAEEVASALSNEPTKPDKRRGSAAPGETGENGDSDPGDSESGVSSMDSFDGVLRRNVQGFDVDTVDPDRVAQTKRAGHTNASDPAGRTHEGGLSISPHEYNDILKSRGSKDHDASCPVPTSNPDSFSDQSGQSAVGSSVPVLRLTNERGLSLDVDYAEDSVDDSDDTAKEPCEDSDVGLSRAPSYAAAAGGGADDAITVDGETKSGTEMESEENEGGEEPDPDSTLESVGSSPQSEDVTQGTARENQEILSGKEPSSSGTRRKEWTETAPQSERVSESVTPSSYHGPEEPLILSEVDRLSALPVEGMDKEEFERLFEALSSNEEDEGDLTSEASSPQDVKMEDIRVVLDDESFDPRARGAANENAPRTSPLFDVSTDHGDSPLHRQTDTAGIRRAADHVNFPWNRRTLSGELDDEISDPAVLDFPGFSSRLRQLEEEELVMHSDMSMDEFVRAVENLLDRLRVIEDMLQEGAVAQESVRDELARHMVSSNEVDVQHTDGRTGRQTTQTDGQTGRQHGRTDRQADRQHIRTDRPTGRQHGRTDGQTDNRDGRTDRSTGRQTTQTDGKTDRQTNNADGRTDRQTDNTDRQRQTDRQTDNADGQTNRKTDKTDGRTDRQTDRQTTQADRQADRKIKSFALLFVSRGNAFFAGCYDMNSDTDLFALSRRCVFRCPSNRSAWI